MAKTDIYFCNLPFLPMDFSHVLDFGGSDEERRNYFRSKTLLVKEGNIKYDSERTYINVNLSIEQLKPFDYLYFYDLNGKPRYYFITNVEFSTKVNSNIYLKLDTWTTYLHNYELLPSFVDRCHVNRWNGDIPTDNNEDEGLAIGEIMQLEKQEICEMGKSIILTASVPIGVIPNVNEELSEGTEGATGGAEGDWENALVSANCLRQNKGYEGFVTGAYDDGFGYDTIGYGITSNHTEAWNECMSLVPMTESEAAQICYDLMNSYCGTVAKQVMNELGLTEQHQFDAICLRFWNCGTGSMTTKLKQAITSGDNDTIVDVWASQYITSKGIPVANLKIRREEEGYLFTTGKYKFQAIAKWTASNGIKKHSGTVTTNNGNGWLPSSTTVAEEG